MTVAQTAFDCLERTRDFLITVARRGSTVTYGELRGQLHIPYAPNGMGCLLDLLSEDCDVAANRTWPPSR